MSQPFDPNQPQDPQHGAAPYGQEVPDDAPTRIQSSSPYGQAPQDAPASPYGPSAPAAPASASQPSAEPAWGSASSPSNGPQQLPGQEGAQQGPGAQSPNAANSAVGGAVGDGANFFKAMLDFSFTHFITVKFSSFLYVVSFLVAALMWLGTILSAIMFGVIWGSMTSYFGDPSFNPVPLILAILFGWIPSVIALIAMRLGLEFAVATVRTAQNTTRIAEAAEKA